MFGSTIDFFYASIGLLILYALIHGLKSGRFGSAYGEKLSIERKDNPVLFWSQAGLMLGVFGLLAWAILT